MTPNELKSIKVRILIGKDNEEKTITLFNIYQMFLKHAQYLSQEYYGDLG